MIHLTRSQVVGPTSPLLWFLAFTPAGYLADPVSAEWKIVKNVSGAWSDVTTWAALTLTTAKLGTGRYAIPWTVPADAAYAVHLLLVRWKLAATDEWTVHGYEFEVWAGGASLMQPTYAFMADMTAEGITGTSARLASCLTGAARQIEQFTGERFTPQYLDRVYLDGSGARDQNLDGPVMALESIVIVDQDRETELDDYEEGDVIVFARHMVGMFQPDDRRDPHLAMYYEEMRFPEGKQNLQLSGVFGFTEPRYDVDGTVLVVNAPPEEIRRANLLMAWKRVPTIGSVEERTERGEQYRIKSETTEGQSYTMDERPGARGLTGDPEVDSVLLAYSRPMKTGAA